MCHHRRVDTDQTCRDRLARKVAARRRELKLTQRDLTRRANISLERVQAVEAARARGLRATTKHELERALLWHDGGIDSILAGYEARAIRSSPLADTDRVQAAIGDLSPHIQEYIRDAIDELSTVRERFGHRAALEAMRHLIEVADHDRAVRGRRNEDQDRDVS